ncbi:MAG: SRPBCC family protein [Gammaproteobacteria bacterium]|nr:SRPBCC family protein [Gammaproteobacteria bacterium]
MTNKIPPLIKTIEVACDRETAFRFYTERMIEWWPAKSHSLSQDEATQIVFEAREGGNLYEKDKNGDIQVWGTVLVWDPPARFVHSWHVGGTPDKASEVEVVFTELDASKTQLRLEHRNWEHFGDEAQATRDHYGSGWESVLDTYINRLKEAA